MKFTYESSTTPVDDERTAATIGKRKSRRFYTENKPRTVHRNRIALHTCVYKSYRLLLHYFFVTCKQRVCWPRYLICLGNNIVILQSLMAALSAMWDDVDNSVP